MHHLEAFPSRPLPGPRPRRLRRPPTLPAEDPRLFSGTAQGYTAGPADLAAVVLTEEDEVTLGSSSIGANGAFSYELPETVGAEALEPIEDAFCEGLAIAERILQADIALLEGQSDEAVRLLEDAVARQDALPYFEPPHWFASARLNLGRALLDLDRPEEAEAVYRADLDAYPHNGRALFGLAESLRAQGKADEAAEAQRRFEEAWRHADTTLTAER